jgi:hypothetical protein
MPARSAKVVKLRPGAQKALLSNTREAKMERIILAAIATELKDVDYFTREDLLQLAPLQSVATITRYHEVCNAVSALTYAGQLRALSRTELCLPSAARSAAKLAPVQDRYEAQVRRLVNDWVRLFGQQPFSVMTLVKRWTMDQHLTINAKRVAVRMNLKRLHRAGAIEAGAALDYIARGNSDD